MGKKRSQPPAPLSPIHDTLSPPGLDPIGHNIEAIVAFYAQEERKISQAQRRLEHLSGFIGRPLYLGSILLFVALWMLTNIVARALGLVEFDPGPFLGLQGIVSLGAWLTATVVLIKQSRLAKIVEQRAHLDLQVNLLTEQKTTKIIDLLEELRRDLPMVKNRHDPEATALQQPTVPHLVLAALDERRETEERLQDADAAK